MCKRIKYRVNLVLGAERSNVYMRDNLSKFDYIVAIQD